MAQIITLAILGMTLLLIGCGSDTKQVRGLVVEVVGRNISQVETLRLRDEVGQNWTFTTEGFVGFTPSHLREHQLFGRPVLVSYIKKGDKLVAVQITD